MPGSCGSCAAPAENLPLAKSTPPPRTTVAAMKETNKTAGCMPKNSAALLGGLEGSVGGQEALRESTGRSGIIPALAAGAGADESQAVGLRGEVTRAKQAAGLLLPAGESRLSKHATHESLPGASLYVPRGHS